ncbi:MAG: efflux RND transporter periplasmic adaptor subunit [Planctomycetota bacterium]
MSSSSRENQGWKYLSWLTPAIILSVSVAGFLFLRSLKAAPSRGVQPPPLPLVETEETRSAPASFDIRVNGTVLPKREVSVAAEVAGTVIFKSDDFDAGKFVKKGTLLLEIDPRTYDLELKRLVSELKQAEVDLLQLELEKSNNDTLIALAETELALSRSEQERVEQLFKRKAASASERDQSESVTMKAQNALQQLANAQRLIDARRDRLTAQLDLTKSRLDKAKLDLEKTKILAPIDGIVAEEMVETSSFVQPGTLIARIEDTEAVEVKCSLRVEDLYWLRNSVEAESADKDAEMGYRYHAPKVPATVTYKVAGRSYSWKGFLSRYEGIGLDEKTRTVPCRVEVPRPAHGSENGELPTLVRGMFVTVDLKASPKVPLLELPLTALRPGNEVWRVENSKLQVRNVRVAKLLDESVLVHHDSENISSGDKVVTTPLAVAIDGMQVRERKTP